MSSFNKAVKGFFDDLVAEENTTTRRYFVYLNEAIAEFFEVGSMQNAYEVYRWFLDIYHINYADKASFLDLLDAMSKYEENVATMNDHQRDHYVHSVNVFLLGLYVYRCNSNYRKCFATQIEKRCENPHYVAIDEEFLFCWGIASLFHDIGYPLEIVSTQIRKYVEFVASVSEESSDAEPFIDFMNFPALDSIQLTNPRLIEVPHSMQSSQTAAASKEIKPTDILAHNLHLSFGLDAADINAAIQGYLRYMQKSRFLDHGFFSAIIVLKWYGELLQHSVAPSSLLFNEIALSSEAILLHNYYAGTLMKSPHDFGTLSPETNALAYLLILCDESQEWNRKIFGEKDLKKLLFINNAQIKVDENSLEIKYVTEAGVFPDDFPQLRKAALYKRLNVEQLFSSGINIYAETVSGYYLEHSLGYLVMPRLLVNHLEQLAQIMVHEDYVAKQKERDPNQTLEYETWDSLPPSMKYSNIRQGAAISDKLSRIRCYLDNEGEANKEVVAFSDQEIEYLAEYEHELWVKEREESGWTFGKVKDTKKKLSPYLVSYGELSDDIKELDRDTIRNIIPLTNAIGYKVYRI